ncbi:MAG: FGGY family carbohydrate kinase [Desulfurococcaceae archaeon]
MSIEKTLIVSIDLGTSSVKVEIYNEHGEKVMENKKELYEQTISSWINTIKEAAPVEFLRSARCRKIVSAASTSGTIIIVDKHGNPLINPIMYYEKDIEMYNKIKDLSSIKELAELGVDFNPASPIPKILRLMENGLLKNAEWIVPPTTWILYKLLYREGDTWREVEVDYTNALKFGADITKETPDWFKPLFEELNIPLEKMPRIAECGNYIGLAESNFARELGLYGAEIYHGMTDGTASALAGGAFKEGDLSIYGGTTVVPKYVTNTLKKHHAIYYHRHPIKGYLASAATSFTGGFLSWFAEKLLGLTVEDLINYADNIEEINEIPLFMPPGDRSPFNDPQLKASILRLYPWDEPREKIIGKFALSIMLGITFLEYYYIDLFEKLFNKPIKEVKLTGGTVKSKKWNLLRASIYEKPVKIYSGEIGVGIVIPALLKSKIFKSIEEIESTLVIPRESINPDQNLTNILRKDRDMFMARWKVLQKIYSESLSINLL